MIVGPGGRRWAWVVAALVALAIRTPAADTPSLVVLDRSAKNGALNMGGEDRLLVDRGGLVVNSSHANALFNANGTVEVKDGGIGVVGGWKALGKATISPEPTHCQPADDPYAKLNMPVATARRSTQLTFVQPGKTLTLQPGLYYGGILAGKDSTVVLEPGQYVFANAGISLPSAAKLRGEGVTLVMSGNQPGQILVGHESLLELTAPTEGELTGLAIASYRADDAVSFNGGQGRIKGAAYVPRGRFEAFFKSKVEITRLICFHLMLNTGSTVQVTGP